MKKLKSFGIWGNTQKEEFWVLLPQIIKWAKINMLETYITEKINNSEVYNSDLSNIIHSKNKIRDLDFMISLGGDGTFMSCVRAVEDSEVPIVGIHLGDLGFLAKVTKKDLFQRLDEIIAGNYKIEERSLAAAIIKSKDGISKHICLNDFVVSNGESHRVLDFQVHVDNSLVAKYKADGLIVATPTGSTAYSLSSGGPIITPNVDSLAITPISPHSLTSRPLVISDSSSVKIDFPDQKDKVTFSTDGQVFNVINPDSIIEIDKANFKIKLLDFLDTDYFKTLRTKMGWGKRGN